MKQILLILLENESGSLSRVIGLFSQRGYNIESITVSPTEDTTISSMTIQTNGDKKIISQIEKQLRKLINVLKVQQIQQTKYIECEIMLIKIKNSGYDIQNMKIIIDIFHGKIVHTHYNTYIVKIIGTNKRINEFLKMIKTTSKIIEMSRSGIIGIEK
ncbi:acetolactate synthase small subunit [Buchnera aphidicola]|uniref:acetolactate synthase small subunit n=1 Tax=Buchnera aphidicola TaxID=9 RepID=UPI003464ABC8